MTNKQIHFSRLTNFTGRNGYMKCSGMDILHLNHSQSCMIAPLTSKNQVGRCDIEIPDEDMPKLVRELLMLTDPSLLQDIISFLQGFEGDELQDGVFEKLMERIKYIEHDNA